MTQTRLLLVVALVGCDHSVEQATDHLRTLGFKVVACSRDGHDATTPAYPVNTQGVT